MLNRPLLVGVTGGIGSGKSTVCKILEVLGHKIYYADDRAKWLMQNDEKIKADIIELLGKAAFYEGRINRAFVGDKVFQNKSLLYELNKLVHPAVGKDLKRWVDENNRERLLFDEAALLFEIGSYKRMDATILVTAPEELRIRRVKQRDLHRSAADVKKIIDKQMNDKQKASLADYVIKNDEMKSVIKQTLAIYEQLLNRCK